MDECVTLTQPHIECLKALKKLNAICPNSSVSRDDIAKARDEHAEGPGLVADEIAYLAACPESRCVA